jgi:hypothetical protein
VIKDLIVAFWVLFHGPAEPCMRRHMSETIEAVQAAVDEFGVPAELLLTIGYLETHWGCSRASGGNWGAPASRLHRNRPGRAHHAASALARAYRNCGRDWRRALMMFRTGRCTFDESRMIGYTPTEAFGVMRRVVRWTSSRTQTGPRRSR